MKTKTSTLGTLVLSVLAPLFGTTGVGAQGESSPPNHASSSVNYTLPATPKYDYAEALHLSLLFYHSQRSGDLGPNRRLAWRGDSCFVCSGLNGEDLSGGYYEAANTMKWGLPLAWTLTQLAFNVYAFGDGMSAMNEIEEAREGVKWGLDYLVNCISSPDQFVGQFGISAQGDTDIDFGYFGPPEEYEMWVPRGLMHVDGIAYINSTNPSSEILGETAAAMAAGSVIFKDSNPDYSSKLLDHSKDLYTRATTYLGTYMTSKHPNLQTVKEWYPSSLYYDELSWASAWLYVATGDAHYLNETQSWGKRAEGHNQEYSWDEKYPGRNALMFMHTQDPQYKTGLEELFKAYLPGGSVKQTPAGLSFYDSWGSVSYAQNIGFLMLVYAKTIGFQQPESQRLLSFVTQQINYALGEYDGRAWMVGFGDNYPLRPYHKSSYNSFIDYPMRGQNQGNVGSDFLYSNTTNRFILYGALEGGPRWDDTYLDNREHYEFTEVTQDYNAAITGVSSGLIEYYGIEKFTPFTDCGLDLGWSHPNASSPPNWGDNDCYHTCNTGCTSTSSNNTNGGNSTNGQQGANTSGGGNGGERRTVVSMGVVSVVFCVWFLAV